MKLLKNIGLILFAVTAFVSCNSLTKGLKISGTIKNASGVEAVLEQLEFNNAINAIGKASIDGGGKFSISSENEHKPGIYRIRIGTKMLFLFLDAKDKNISIEGDMNDLEKYNVKIAGSKGSEEYASLMQQIVKGTMDINALKGIIQNSPSVFVSAILSFQYLQGDFTQNLPIYKSIAEKLNQQYPGSTYAKDYANIVTQTQAQLAQEQAQQKIKIGEMAPDISLPGVDGKNRSLSSLKGKIVLLDFWASWCGPCRRENPNVVALYKKYKDKGFTVYSVSLDGIDSRTAATISDPKQLDQQTRATKQNWLAAIKADGLEWENHVSDLKKWECAAAQAYGVHSIPNTYLLDRTGKIVAINPRENLEEELKKIL